MQEHNRLEDYLSMVTQRLKADGFSIANNVTYRNQTFKCIARRGRFHAEFFGCYAEFFFLFAEFQHIDSTLIREFSAKCFKYVRRSKIIPFLPFVPLNSYFCFPVALVHSIDDDTAEAVRNQDPGVHFGSGEWPVVCDLAAKQLYYSEKNPLRGGLYHDYFREIIRNMLSP